jgi:cell division protein FtsQ
VSGAAPPRGRTGRRWAQRHRRPSPRPTHAARRPAGSPHRLTPRGRRWLLAGVAGLALVLAGIYVAVVRELAVFRIEAVAIEGASSGYGRRLAEELGAGAREMTTLHVREDELRRIAERYPGVVSLEATAGLPNRLVLRIVERPPVGVVRGRRGRLVPVAADGKLLGGQPVDRPLPRLDGRVATTRGRASAITLAAARLASATPGPLGAWLERIERQASGWVVELRGRGPDLRFGSLSELDRKWSAAAAVLAARSARGADFVDVTVPDRPSVGGSGGDGRVPTSLGAGERIVGRIAATAPSSNGRGWRTTLNLYLS